MSNRKFKYPPIHPGIVLLLEFLEPLNLSSKEFAKKIDVSERRVNEIVQGERAISRDTSRRLSRYFKMSAGFFTRLQQRYNREVTQDLTACKMTRIRNGKGNRMT